MQEQLIFYLNEQRLTRLDGAPVDANSLQLPLQNQPVIVLVPAEEVLLTTVHLPKINRSRLYEVLPFALEEQLAGDINQLHMAVGEPLSSGDLPVAIVAKEKMQQWMQWLHDLKVVPDILLPLSLVLPYRENTFSVLKKNNTAIVRLNEHMGFGCDEQNLTVMLNIALQNSHHQTHIDYLSHDQSLILSIADEVMKPPVINLLQAEYAPKKPIFLFAGKANKILLYLFFSWIGLLFFSPIVSYFMLDAHLATINDKMKTIYQRQFPQATSMVAAKLRMEEKWQRLSAQIGENKLLLLLGYIGQAMKVVPEVSLKQFEFQNNRLVLEVNAVSSEKLVSFTENLQQRGLKIKQQNATLTGTRINANLLIE